MRDIGSQLAAIASIEPRTAAIAAAERTLEAARDLVNGLQTPGANAQVLVGAIISAAQGFEREPVVDPRTPDVPDVPAAALPYDAIIAAVTQARDAELAKPKVDAPLDAGQP